MDLKKYLGEARKGKTFDQMVKSLDNVIDNIIGTNPSKDEVKVIQGMITALQKKINQI